MALIDRERKPPIVENGRIPVDVDAERDLLNAEDAAIAAGTPELPDGEFRLDLDDGKA